MCGFLLGLGGLYRRNAGRHLKREVCLKSVGSFLRDKKWETEKIFGKETKLLLKCEMRLEGRGVSFVVLYAFVGDFDPTKNLIS